jgi:hypothetical protein
MDPGQQLPERKFLIRASRRQRLIAAIVFLAIAAGFLLAWLMGHYHFSPWPFACGFKQRYGLPCPTCGMTHSVLAFAQGNIILSFYSQPAAALFCCLAVVAAFFAFLTAVFGIYSPTFERGIISLKLRYIIAAILVIFAAGWAVTLAMALAQKGSY